MTRALNLARPAGKAPLASVSARINSEWSNIGGASSPWDFENATVKDQSSLSESYNITVDLPPHSEGDQLFIFVLSEKSCLPTYQLVPTGWTALRRTGTDSNSNVGGTMVLHKTATASEPVSVTIERDSSTYHHRAKQAVIAVRAQASVPTVLQSSYENNAGGKFNTSNPVAVTADGYHFLLCATGNTGSDIDEVLADPPMTLVYRATGVGGATNMSGILLYEPAVAGVDTEARRVEWTGTYNSNNSLLSAVI